MLLPNGYPRGARFPMEGGVSASVRMTVATDKSDASVERGYRRRLAVGLAVAGLLIPFAAPVRAAHPTPAAGGEASAVQRGDFAGRVEIRGGRELYLACRGRGRPAVILVSGYGTAPTSGACSIRG
jgi:hypothetical protein